MKKELTQKELIELVDKLNNYLNQEMLIPASIFASKLSPAEVLVKYLKENKKMKYSEIAKALNRDQRGIWCTHRRAKQKQKQNIVVLNNKHEVPISLFTDRKLSILEHTVKHLRENKMPLKDIAVLIDKNPSTIAVVNHRVKKKQM